MSDVKDTVSCAEEDSASWLPNRPYLANRYHYGMLLGVEDFITDQAYHRGKIRLHNAWLHGAGVAWGLEVSVDVGLSEIRVAPGLAYDGFGRELHVDTAQCVNIGRWFAEHRNDAGFSSTENDDGSVSFPARVILRHHACLMRPVPALVEPCAGAVADTEFSRVFETGELLIVPGEPLPAPRRNHLLRIVAGLDAPVIGDDGNLLADDQAALAARDAIGAAAAEERTATAARELSRIAALDTLRQQSGDDPDDVEAGLFPKEARAEVTLAHAAEIRLAPSGDTWTLTSAVMDNLERDTLVSTETLQALLAALGYAAGTLPAIGPRVKAETLARAGTSLSFEVDAPLAGDSVRATAFTASSFTAGTGWSDIAINAATLSADGLTVTLTLAADPTGSLFRLIARGTGPSPLLGGNELPLFGERASRPSGTSDAVHGRDFVWMQK